MTGRTGEQMLAEVAQASAETAYETAIEAKRLANRAIWIAGLSALLAFAALMVELAPR